MHTLFRGALVGLLTFLTFNVRAEPSCVRQSSVKPAEIWHQALDFLRDVDVVNRQEPYLVLDSRFAKVQGFTLKYEKFGSDLRTSGEFRRLWLQPGATLPVARLVKAYRTYAIVANELANKILPHARWNLDMIEDLKFRAEYLHAYNTALASAFPGQNGEVARLQPLTCDYTAQPLDALWFALNAWNIIDRYGNALCANWNAIKNPAPDGAGLKSLAQIHLDLAEGLVDED